MQSRIRTRSKNTLLNNLLNLPPRNLRSQSTNGLTLLQKEVVTTTKTHPDKYSPARVTFQKTALSFTKFVYTIASTKTSICTSTFMKMVQQDVKKE